MRGLAELLELLDVFNRDRFRGDATLLGLWTSLRKVKRRASRRRDSEVDDASEVPVATQPAAAEPAPASGSSDGELPPRDGGLSNAA